MNVNTLERISVCLSFTRLAVGKKSWPPLHHVAFSMPSTESCVLAIP